MREMERDLVTASLFDNTSDVIDYLRYLLLLRHLPQVYGLRWIKFDFL